MKNIKIKGTLLTFVLIFALIFAVSVTAHPGHGTPEIIDSEPGTGSSTTDTSGSTYTGGSDSGSSSVQSSTSVSQSEGSSNSGTQSTSTTSSDQVVTSSTSVTSYSSPGGPAALVGLMMVLSLIAFSFPFKNTNLRRLQENFGF